MIYQDKVSALFPISFGYFDPRILLEQLSAGTECFENQSFITDRYCDRVLNTVVL